ncbi:luciferase family protein [Bacillus cereus group sp. BfR-BA-01331]|uniref:luciferase domain-containing protein n=1 Tax=Bacillus cereus group sp. BfR-BA-01331 TaxID=2920307 RepID=UPI001F58B2C8|nr:luciferase family protein [Bacillus cereus group sp. BfR-BA-01331]
MSEVIRKEVLSWGGVSEKPHRFGGVELNYGKKELGHLHGDKLADLSFPKLKRDELINQGSVQPHHVLPESGWISYYIKSEEDIPFAVELFRMQYDRIQKRNKVDK